VKVIAQKIWHEPAAFIGLLVTLGLLVLNLVGNDEWGAQTWVEVLAPFVSSLGIRQLVTPVAALQQPSEGTTYQPPPPDDPAAVPPSPTVNPATKLPSKPPPKE
jgi:hypothetical protein